MIKPWRESEDAIIISMREYPNTYNIREISEVLVNRSRSATANRLLILRRKRLIL